jgi:hypothetical protein
MLKKIIAASFVLSTLSACGGGDGGGGVTLSATALNVFNDGAGVGRVVRSNGSEFVYIGPNIVADVNATNGSSSVTPIDITLYPIVSQSNGYNFRQGTSTENGLTVNVIVAEKIGSGTASIAYIYNNSADAIAAGGGSFNSAPSGSHTYSGMYLAGGRYSSFAEIGSLSMTANFSNNTFSINGTSTNSSLTGTGFIDPANGRISSANLTFTKSGSSYGATTMGNLSGNGATDVSGVFYTNDTNPDYAGAYAGSR